MIKQKPFYAKFLPVNKKIEPGDWVIYPLEITVPIQFLGGDLIGTEIPVELFICSRDIKIGDRVIYVKTGEERVVMEASNAPEFGKKWCTPDAAKYKHAKVIGKLSEKSLWVKEGDEFEESQLKIENKIVTIISSPLKKKLRPCDCEDMESVKRLNEQGISHNDEEIVLRPNHVLLTMGNTSIKISMTRFKMFAEWFLQEQEINK